MPVVAVARVFRRGDFRGHWRAKPCPGLTGTSYNFGAAGRAKNHGTMKDINRAKAMRFILEL
jgi:hypothetical protein